jgi:hypothetical protein
LNPKKDEGIEFKSFDSLDIIQGVYNQITIPELTTLSQFEADVEYAFIVILDYGKFDTEEMNVLKRLLSYVKDRRKDWPWITETTIKRVDCFSNFDLCNIIGKNQQNKIIVFSGRSRHAYEVFHGSFVVEEILAFAKSVVTHRMHTFTPENIEELLADGSEWILGMDLNLRQVKLGGGYFLRFQAIAK